MRTAIVSAVNMIYQAFSSQVSQFSYSYIFNNLDSGKNYSVIVSTRTDVTQDPIANTTIPHEAFDVFKPGTVTDVFLPVNCTPTCSSIRVAWDPPFAAPFYDDLLMISAYRIVIELVTDNMQNNIVDVTVSADVFMMLFTNDDGVIPGAVYNVRIFARNAAGENMGFFATIFTPDTGLTLM